MRLYEIEQDNCSLLNRLDEVTKTKELKYGFYIIRYTTNQDSDGNFRAFAFTTKDNTLTTKTSIGKTIEDAVQATKQLILNNSREKAEKFGPVNTMAVIFNIEFFNEILEEGDAVVPVRFVQEGNQLYLDLLSEEYAETFDMQDIKRLGFDKLFRMNPKTYAVTKRSRKSIENFLKQTGLELGGRYLLGRRRPSLDDSFTRYEIEHHSISTGPETRLRLGHPAFTVAVWTEDR